MWPLPRDGLDVLNSSNELAMWGLTWNASRSTKPAATWGG